MQSDTELSYLWFAPAAQNGDARAIRNIDKLRASISPAQIAEAECLLAEWEPNPAECEIETAGTTD